MSDWVTPGVTRWHLETATWAARLGYSDEDCCGFVKFVCREGKLGHRDDLSNLMREYLEETKN